MADHVYIKNMSTGELRGLQKSINRLLKRTGIDWAPLIEDGKPGPMTQKYIRRTKYLLGLSAKFRNTKVTAYYRWRLDHPFYIRKDKNGKPREADRTHVHQGKINRKHERKMLKDLHAAGHIEHGLAMYDGKPVFAGAVDVLNWCRSHGWGGVLVSGYRTPEYSEHLCIQMCGHPSCPGLCAGRATNHAHKEDNRFAMDVSDYLNFARIVARCPLQPKVHNALPRDLVHFSPSGG